MESRPRKEAQPFADRSVLTRDQERALAQIPVLLRALPENSPAQPHGFLPQIDAQRRNHVFLIEGGRGSGKSSVLLTLMDAWSKRYQGKPPNDLGIDMSVKGLVPMLLDLQPIPPSTHLLLFLLGQLHLLVEQVEKQPPYAQSAAWSPDADHEHKLRGAWCDLLRSACGWGDQLKDRRAHIDPETYVTELEQAERDRHRLRPSFQRFMDLLCKEFKPTDGHPPLFLIAIDDADMCPMRSLQLLEILRLLWHPRLAFLLTGHEDLFLIALRNDLLGELRTPLRGLTILSHEDPNTGDIQLAVRLASEIYNKLVPLHQRFALPPLGADVRKDKLKPLFTGVDSAEGKSLSWYINENRVTRYALPDRMRGVKDLEAFVKSIPADPPRAADSTSHPRKIDQIVKRIWDDALDMSQLLGEQRTFLRPAVHTSADRQGLVVEDRNLRIGATHHVLWEIEGNCPGLTLQVVEPRWHVDFQDERAHLPAFKGAWTRLPAYVLAALMLAMDVADEGPPSHLRLSMPPLGPEQHPITWRLTRPDQAVQYIPLPLPRWRSFRRYRQVTDAICKSSSSAMPEQELVEKFLLVVLQQAGVTSMEDPQAGTKETKDPWPDLESLLTKEHPKGRDGYINWEWAHRFNKTYGRINHPGRR